MALAALASADDCSFDALKKCYNLEYMFQDTNVKWPTDDAGVVKLCTKLLEGGACLKAFNDRCNKNAHDKKLLDELLKTLKNHEKEVCSTKEVRQKFLDRTKCYKNDKVRDEVKDEHQRYVGVVESIVGLPKAEHKPSVCCAVLYVRDAIRATNVKNCDPSVVQYLDKVIKDIVSFVFLLNMIL